MGTLASALINWSALWKIILVALIGGGGVVMAFGLTLLALERARTAGRRHVRLAHRTLASAGGLFCVGAVAVGIYAMAAKPVSKSVARPKSTAPSAASQRGNQLSAPRVTRASVR